MKKVCVYPTQVLTVKNFVQSNEPTLEQKESLNILVERRLGMLQKHGG